jgi:L-ascorbate metabolism protein UlaG (beta-lactamase superfamily)
MSRKGLTLAGLVACWCLCWAGAAAAWFDDPVSAATIAARQRFFGAENVDPRFGFVRPDRVIFSWVTNTTLAVSVRGRVVMLDAYINRLEVAPPAGQPDLRRTPIDVHELIDLHPEAIFLGHGHGDHADNAAYVAKWLNIPIYASPETCDVMQADVARMAADPNAANGGVKLVPDANPVVCKAVVSRGSVPGAEVNTIDQLDPIACIIAFKHIHSGLAPTDPTFPLIPVVNSSDSREGQLYPPGLCVTPTTANGFQGCLGVGVFHTPQPGQENLTTTGFGNIPGSAGGAISLFYQFVLRGENAFTFVWHNTTGPLKEGIGSDPGLPSPAVGAQLFSIMEQLPQTNIEFGSIVSLGFTTNGERDAILYQQHIKPQIYVPLHMTDVAAVGSSLEWKKTYLESVVAADIAVRPELRWLVDPDDYLRPMSYDPDDRRWFIPGRRDRVAHFCHHDDR